jgi:hypothetical protein
VYAVCKGDWSKRENVLDTMTLTEAVKWNHLGAYDAVIQEELNEIALERAKKKAKQRG